jgi:hypothetical protein
VRKAEAYIGGHTIINPRLERWKKKHRKATDAAAKWLGQHSNDPPEESAEARRQRRMARAKRDQIAKRNAPILKRIEKQERRLAHNMAIIKRENER